MPMPPPLLTPAQLAAAQRSLGRRSFRAFVRLFWEVVVPEPFVHNWHLDVLADALQAAVLRAAARQPKLADLVLNVPPGTGKSTLCTVLLPAWAWAVDPTLRIITGSYSADLATNHALKTRDVLTCDLYRLLFPEVKLRRDKNLKHEQENTRGGCRTATSVGGTITGKHAHLIVVDDPLNPRQAAARAERTAANDWLDRTLSQRKTDKAVSVTVLVMQRLHQHDCTGHVLAKAGKQVQHICLPAEATRAVAPAELAERYIENLLDPVRLNAAVLREARIDLGAYAFAGQMLQAPAPEGGGLVKAHWLGMYKEGEAPPDAIWHLAIDPAYTANTANDPTGILCYAYANHTWFVRHAEAAHLELPELLRHLLALASRFGLGPRSRILIEPKASGKSLAQLLRQQAGMHPVEAPAPTLDKVARLHLASPHLEAGRIRLLAHAPWLPAFVNELTAFPNAPHDDLVDALVMAIRHHQTGNGVRW